MGRIKCPRIKKPRVLFILKKHEVYGTCMGLNKSSGLQNSAEFVSEMLIAQGFESAVVTVVDNNDIDREVSQFKPDVVMIEALWVVPEKFDVLKKLHPNVKWVVRVHSNVPFLANEGIAIGWMRGYSQRGVMVASNSLKAFEDFKSLDLSLIYLPNYYPDAALSRKRYASTSGVLNVGCFGAIRPLKNQLSQAIAAIRFARENNLLLRFHVNASRVEDNGSSVLKNLRALFTYGSRELVEHDWQEHEAFLNLLDEMDIVLSVSLSETFSIATADAVSRRIPVVTSSEVAWIDPEVMASPTDTQDIAEKMVVALNKHERLCQSNIKRLERFSQEAKDIWTEYLGVEKKQTLLAKTFNWFLTA